MPSGPPNGYNSGSYPAPDQGNGISIYNGGAPQSPSGQGGYNQAPSYPQQLQPANGSQPPNYDAPLQTQPAQPSVVPSQAPHSAAPQQPQSSPAQQPSQQPSSTQEPQNTQQTGQDQQRQTQCQQAAAEVAAQSAGPAIPTGGGRGLLLGGFGRGGRWKLDPPPPTNPSCPDCPPSTQKQGPSDAKGKQAPKIAQNFHWWGWSENIQNSEGMTSMSDDFGHLVNWMQYCAGAGIAEGALAPPPFDAVGIAATVVCAVGAGVIGEEKQAIDTAARDGMCITLNQTWAFAYWTERHACG